MKRVTGIGGIFFKCKDPEKTRAWYHKHLGIQSSEYGGTFEWRYADDREKKGYTAWSPFPAKSSYFSPSDNDFMLNYRVDDLKKLLAVLKEEGVEIVGDMEEFEYGTFGWIMDPDGQKVELWEPNDKAYEELLSDEVSPNKSA